MRNDRAGKAMMRRDERGPRAIVAWPLFVLAVVWSPPLSFAEGALKQLGLFPGADFRISTGRCDDCQAPRAALWYFQDEVIAVPQIDAPAYPFLVWVGSPEILYQVATSAVKNIVKLAGGKEIRLVLTPKIPANRSYYDDSTDAFFQKRTLRIRGTTQHIDGLATFVARTI